ncbi:MAG: PAS domain-containing protein [Acidobacteria bacterium]|nr:PAS domain-containing protein [Acidobacteriota bacterium]
MNLQRPRLDLPVIIGLASLAIVSINVAVSFRTIRNDRDKTIATTIRDNSNLVLGFEQHVTRTLGIAEATTQLLKREFLRGGPRVDLVSLKEQGTLDSDLIKVGSIIREDGSVLASTDGRSESDLSPTTIASELSFHASDQSNILRVGIPERATPSGPGLIPVSRRLSHADGSFAGMALVVMESVRFTEFYDEVPHRPHDLMLLLGHDGVVRARQSGQTHMSGGKLPASSIFAREPEAERGNALATSSVDGVRRFLSYRKLEKFPFLVAVGVAENDALADVTQRVRNVHLRSGILTLLIATFAFLLIRALKRRERALALLTASESLRASEQEFRTVTESLPQLVWITEADGTHTYFNQRWIDYTGLSLEQSVGEGWTAAFEPTERAAAGQRWRDAVAKGELYETKYRLRRADGTYRWMLARASALRDVDGRITKWFGTSTDVDAQVTVQAQLDEAQQVAHIGSWSRDQKGVHIWSDELYNIFGLSPDEFVPTYESIGEYVHPDDRPQYLRDCALSIATMEPFERDARIIRPDGEVRSVHHLVAVEKDASGVGRRVHGTVQDVTEARAAEQKLREQANLLNLTHDAFIVRDADDTIRFWNHGAEKLYGWTAEEVIGRRSADFAYLDRDKFLDAKKLLAERGEWSGELEHLCKDGHSVMISSRWSALPNERNGANAVLVVNTDLTERRKLEQQLLRNQRLESVGTLASGVAHDLNNILAPILMAAPLLRDELPREKREKLVTLLEECAERGASIVNQVLTFARGAEGERLLLQPIYALNEVTQIIAETFPKSITVQTIYPEDLCLIEIDPTHLHQILLNLCVNARDAMADGGVLSLSAKNFEIDEHYAAMTPGTKAGLHLLIEVTDTGSGIRPEIMEKIFDPFFTTKDVRSGTGLGLSTVLGLVKEYGGTVNAESLGRGTTFRVLLPAAGASFQPGEAIAVEDLPRGNGETIMVVDDEDPIRSAAEPLLQKYGYEVLLAEDGPTALALFAQHSDKIALVLTDLAMPIMSGIALARTLRKMQPDAAIIISTGRDDDCSPAEMEEIGVVATLPKPYTQAALLRLLHDVLSPK